VDGDDGDMEDRKRERGWGIIVDEAGGRSVEEGGTDSGEESTLCGKGIDAAPSVLDESTRSSFSFRPEFSSSTTFSAPRRASRSS
jgi:hypothetical protein